MNRRDFLQPRRLARSASQLLSVLEESPPDHLEAELSLLRVARRAMATSFEILLPCGTPFGCTAASAGLDLIDRLEDQMSVYRDNSDVSSINQRAADEAVPVEEGLFGLLKKAEQITQETDGAFDITTGALIKAWGFFRRKQRVPSDGERSDVLTRVGMKHVLLDAERRTVRIRRPGLELNLGSIGKGYALDRVADTLQRDWGVRAGLLHGGHSSVYAIGTQPGDRRGWTVGIRHPWDPKVRLAVVRLKDQALGTSAASFQHLEYNGRKLGHLLDPRTGWPAEQMASATVVAPTAAEADALATAFFILGAERARSYCAAHPSIGAVLLPAGADAIPVVTGVMPLAAG